MRNTFQSLSPPLSSNISLNAFKNKLGIEHRGVIGARLERSKELRHKGITLLKSAALWGETG